MNYGHLAVLLMCLSGMSSCANTELTRTSFLADRDALIPAPEHEVAWIPDGVELFIDEDADLSSITHLVLAPVIFDFSQTGVETLPSQADQDYLIEEFASALREELSEEFAISSEEGEDTLLLRVALTDVDEEWVWLNILGLILVVPPDMGGISCELEVVESRTGKRVLAMAARREGTVFLLLEAFHEWGHAKHGMEKWAKLLHSELARLRTQSSVRP